VLLHRPERVGAALCVEAVGLQDRGERLKSEVSGLIRLQVSGGQPRFSRDAIAEFQYLSSRFDATQGRSTGIQVNAITKSGANTASGSFSGYFRDDAFNAADFITGDVFPYSNQQVSVTYGGLILKDRLHYFANYEYEREPQTLTFNTPYPRFNIPLTGTRRTDMAGMRLDYQFSSRMRLMTRGNMFTYKNPYEVQQTGQQVGGHPAGTENFRRHSEELFGTLTQVLTDRMMNEIRVGFNNHLQNRELHVPSRSPAGGSRHRVRSPSDHVQRLPGWRQRPDAAEQQRGRLPVPGRLDALVQQGRMARREAGGRVR
jgi:hypothetical protein